MSERGMLFVYRCCCVDETDEDACWIWQQTTNSDDYPIARLGGSRRQVSVRRFVYQRCFGVELRRNQFLSSTCEHARCVNPEHCEVVSKSVYTRRRGPLNAAWRTSVRAGRRRRAKIDAEKARQIRQRLEAGELQRLIAKDFGISRSAVSQVGAGTIWREPSPWAI